MTVRQAATIKTVTKIYSDYLSEVNMQHNIAANNIHHKSFLKKNNKEKLPTMTVRFSGCLPTSQFSAVYF